jgi:hypothetical protein
LIVCATVAVPIQQRVFRYRAEHLLTDMQSIEFHKTPWAQAQTLMHRWGAWGHYEGSCTWTNCKYTIVLSDLSGFGSQPEQESWFHKVTWPIVQDGTIWRTFLAMNVDVPPRSLKRDDPGYELIAYAQSRASLNREAQSRHSHWILGDDAQLAEHPYYKGGRPGGCEICMSVEVTYSTATAQDEVRRLTAFDLSCLTRWRPCTRVEDILPASKPWHLYWLDGDPALPEPVKGPPTACATPVWALGRDAVAVYTVEVRSATTEKSKFDGYPYEVAHARLLETLKGETPWPSGSVMEVLPDSGRSNYPPFEAPEWVEIGKRYFVLVRYPYSGFEARPPFIDGTPGISLEHCGVLADTPENRLELQRGFAQNDNLRVPEL